MNMEKDIPKMIFSPKSTLWIKTAEKILQGTLFLKPRGGFLKTSWWRKITALTSEFYFYLRWVIGLW